MNKIKNTIKGFTLIELLVVVLIIGILAAIALPQYKTAVTKSKVASILPIMRRWKDALAEYKLRYGSYCKVGMDGNCEEWPNANEIGVNWPSDWECSADSVECSNDYWDDCISNEEGGGSVYCYHKIDSSNEFLIGMYQPDDPIYEDFRGKITCLAVGSGGHKICKALGGKLPEGQTSEYILY